MHETARADSAAVSNANSVGLEGTVFKRVALHGAPVIQHTFVANSHHARFGKAGAIIEDARANPCALESEEQRLERRSIENAQEGVVIEFPEALVGPEQWIVE